MKIFARCWLVKLTVIFFLFIINKNILAQTLPIRGGSPSGVEAELTKDVNGKIQELKIYQGGKVISSRILDNVDGNTVIQKIKNALGNVLSIADTTAHKIATETAANLLQSEINLDGQNILAGRFIVKKKCAILLLTVWKDLKINFMTLTHAYKNSGF